MTPIRKTVKMLEVITIAFGLPATFLVGLAMIVSSYRLPYLDGALLKWVGFSLCAWYFMTLALLRDDRWRT